MKSMKVPVLIDYATVPRRYRSLLHKLQRGRWTRPELRWLQRHHAHAAGDRRRGGPAEATNRLMVEVLRQHSR
jgi:hypothetical protein